ncbi:MAG: PAS domain S-box protein [Deltaproteobacteria bacterium]|nr:PAS domain S-box protein [Deltaproteobacteria bacterium]
MKGDKKKPDQLPVEVRFRLTELEEALSRMKAKEEELLHRDERYRRLMEISRIIGSTLNIDEVYERFAREVKTLIPFDRISVNLINLQEYSFTHAYVSGEDVPERQAGTVVPLAGSGAEEVLGSRSTLWVREGNRAEVAARFPALAPVFEAGFRSSLLIPLISQNQVIGVLNIGSRQPDVYSSSDISLAEGIAAQVAGAIANSRLYAGVRRAEEALRVSEEKYRTLVENAAEAIFILQDEKIKFANGRAIALSGLTAEEITRTPFAELIHPDDREIALERHGRRIQGEIIPGPQAYRYLNKSGEILWVQMNSVPITWEGRPATLHFARDLTQEKKLEAQFQMAQKMEAVGTLAGGIAHDFNNILMGIQGHISLMLFDLDSSHPHYESLKKIEEQVKSGANLARQLLAFARRGKYEVKATELNQIVQRSSSMFERTKKEIKVFRKYQEKIWPVEVDRNQIEQVLLNLYVNAWQAMQEGGNLYLETQNITLGPDYIKPFAVQPGRYVRISVRDSGVGMDKKTADRIFEPFFTTKEMGRGTGLGLASVYGIVKNHGGFITVYSEAGHGTSFHIYLPASEMEIAEEKKLPGEILGGKETVLLVDDEETIVEVIEKALILTGFKVLVARGGEEAVEVFKKNRERIDIVILDMIMPGMGGGKVFDSLRAIQPGVKVVLSSGYSIDGEASQIMSRGCNGFIQKPFGIKELSQKIREVMGEK